MINEFTFLILFQTQTWPKLYIFLGYLLFVFSLYNSCYEHFNGYWIGGPNNLDVIIINGEESTRIAEVVFKNKTFGSYCNTSGTFFFSLDIVACFRFCILSICIFCWRTSTFKIVNCWPYLGNAPAPIKVKCVFTKNSRPSLQHSSVIDDYEIVSTLDVVNKFNDNSCRKKWKQLIMVQNYWRADWLLAR